MQKTIDKGNERFVINIYGAREFKGIMGDEIRAFFAKLRRLDERVPVPCNGVVENNSGVTDEYNREFLTEIESNGLRPAVTRCWRAVPSKCHDLHWVKPRERTLMRDNSSCFFCGLQARKYMFLDTSTERSTITEMKM